MCGLCFRKKHKKNTPIKILSISVTDSSSFPASKPAKFLTKMPERTESESEVDEFLKRCEQSGDSAYAALRSLLERLDDPITRSEARIFLTSLQRRFPTKEASQKCFDDYHFRIEDIVLDQYEGQSLLIALLPL